MSPVSGPFRPGMLRSARPLSMLLLAAFFWGSGNIANKTVLDDIDPWSAVCLRCAVAALVLLPFALAEARRHDDPRWRKSSVLPSALFATALLLQQKGYETATVTNASFLVNAACVLTPILAFLLFREMAGRSTILAAILMFAGAFAMSGSATSLGALNPGDVLCLMSALAYAAWTLALGRHALRHGRPVATTVIHCGIAAVVTLPVAGPALAGQGLAGGVPVPLGAVPEILYLGIFSTALAFLLTVAAQERVSASVAGIVVSAESLFGAAGGIVFLGERPDGSVLTGAALMLAAIAIVALSPVRPPARPPTCPRIRPPSD